MARLRLRTRLVAGLATSTRSGRSPCSGTLFLPRRRRSFPRRVASHACGQVWAHPTSCCWLLQRVEAMVIRRWTPLIKSGSVLEAQCQSQLQRLDQSDQLAAFKLASPRSAPVTSPGGRSSLAILRETVGSHSERLAQEPAGELDDSMLDPKAPPRVGWRESLKGGLILLRSHSIRRCSRPR